MAVKYSENVAVKDSNSASDSQNSPESSIQKNISYSSKDLSLYPILFDYNNLSYVSKLFVVNSKSEIYEQ